MAVVSDQLDLVKRVVVEVTVAMGPEVVVVFDGDNM
jgi:hypothetical protein